MSERGGAVNIVPPLQQMAGNAMRILLIFALTSTFIAWACVIVGGRSERK